MCGHGRVTGKRSPIGRPWKILVVQVGDLGDVVVSFPVLRTLRGNFPEAHIACAVRKKAAELARQAPGIDRLIVIDTDKRTFREALDYQFRFFRRIRRSRYDLAIDLRTDSRGAILTLLSGAGRRIGFHAQGGDIWRNRMYTDLFHAKTVPGQHMTEYLMDLLRAFQVRPGPTQPVFPPSAKSRRQAIDLFEKEQIDHRFPMVAVQPFSLWRYKEWGERKYAELVRRLTSESEACQVVVTGSPGELERARRVVRVAGSKRVVNLAGKTTIGVLPGVLEKCDLFVGGDSAGMHIAAAVGTPTVSIFGPADPQTWAPRGEMHRVVKKEMHCMPCCRKGCGGLGISRCLETLSVGAVHAAVVNQLSKLNESKWRST